MPSRLRSKYEFMYDAWGLDSNPFPVSTINTSPDYINEEVFPQEFEEFRQKLIVDAILSGRALGFLWSIPPTPGGEDTGLGKTGTLRRIAWRLNQDWGRALMPTNMRKKLPASSDAIALYASFDRNKITSLNAVLFQALVYAADPKNTSSGQSIVQLLRNRVVEGAGLESGDVDGVRAVIDRTRAMLGPGRPHLRTEAVQAFAEQDDTGETLSAALARVTETNRQRNGLEYFEAFFTLAQSAGVPHVFVFVDQVEDLANRTVPRAKRVKEVERVRDVAFENQYFAGKLHFIFTLHARAQWAIQDIWREARLPRFDRTAVTDEYIVTLRGVQNDQQVAELLRTYLSELRPERPEDVSPFEGTALSALRETRDARVGPILELARQAFDNAAARNKTLIDGSFIRALVDGSPVSASEVQPPRGSYGRDARVIDDVLT